VIFLSNYELVNHPKFPEFLSSMLLTLDKFYKLDDEMKNFILRSFENWLKRVGEAPPTKVVIKCPCCGRPIEIHLTAKSLI